ncbi:hypothetical protein ACC668_30530 [Rhizobium ruizarguesonis]
MVRVVFDRVAALAVAVPHMHFDPGVTASGVRHRPPADLSTGEGARPDREMIMTGLSSLMSVVARPQGSLSDRYLPLGIGCVPQFL